ncbi:CerR family C-terminal domain-containing protein [Agrobacterium sp. rho-8.1]|nr:CerR family C-terminal domain-containing protein [Agrobacterium sp. rho-8.1]
MADGSGDRLRGSYAKSDVTRQAVLTAALSEFGLKGFSGATTRAIADSAGVALPAIAYHFGNKEGLYLACAREIVAAYQASALSLMSDAAHLFQSGQPSPQQCRTLLSDTLKMVLRLFLDSKTGEAQADFAMRELRDRGPAFDILYDRLWQPGVEVVAQLICAIRTTQTVTQSDRADALLLISSLLAFGTGRDVSLRILGLEQGQSQTFDVLDKAIERAVTGL